MAEFCKQCSLERGIPCGLAGEISWAAYWWQKLVGYFAGTVTVCEDCGCTIVDPAGRCLDPGCPKHGRTHAR